LKIRMPCAADLWRSPPNAVSPARSNAAFAGEGFGKAIRFVADTVEGRMNGDPAHAKANVDPGRERCDGDPARLRSNWAKNGFKRKRPALLQSGRFLS
jgi:hypothetical protein